MADRVSYTANMSEMKCKPLKSFRISDILGREEFIKNTEEISKECQPKAWKEDLEEDVINRDRYMVLKSSVDREMDDEQVEWKYPVHYNITSQMYPNWLPWIADKLKFEKETGNLEGMYFQIYQLFIDLAPFLLFFSYQYNDYNIFRYCIFVHFER